MLQDSNHWWLEAAEGRVSVPSAGTAKPDRDLHQFCRSFLRSSDCRFIDCNREESPMSGRTYITGAVALPILIFSAPAAQSAFAGQRAIRMLDFARAKLSAMPTVFREENVAALVFCLMEETPQGTGTNAKTASGTTAASTAKLRGALAGVETEISCGKVSLTPGNGTWTPIHTSVVHHIVHSELHELCGRQTCRKRVCRKRRRHGRTRKNSLLPPLEQAASTVKVSPSSKERKSQALKSKNAA